METTFYSDVDRLGLLLAQIADLTKQANDIKATLKKTPGKTFEGNLFRAVVIEQERVSYDTEVMKAMLEHLSQGQEILDFAKRESFVVSVKVTARAAD